MMSVLMKAILHHAKIILKRSTKYRLQYSKYILVCCLFLYEISILKLNMPIMLLIVQKNKMTHHIH